MANVAFGVRQTANGIGTTDTDIRHMLAQKWLNKGVVGGLQVSGGSTMAYNVSAGMAICSRGASDGFTEAYWSGGATPTVEANASSNPRIDVIWITAHDMSQGDTDNFVTIGVTKGTAAASPSAPTIPTYATEVARMLLPGGSTTTKNATVNASRLFAIPYGASLGVLADKTFKATQTIQRGAPFTYASATVNLPTDRLVSVKMTANVRAANTASYDWIGSGYLEWTLDGTVMRAFRFTCNPYSPSSVCVEDMVTMQAGTHVITARLWGSGTSPVSDIVADYSGENWPGQRLIIADGGVVV